MKCKNCKYCDVFYECNVFGEKMPKEFADKNGGCLLHYKEKEKLKKLFEKITKECMAENKYEFLGGYRRLKRKMDYHKYLDHLRKKYLKRGKI